MSYHHLGQYFTIVTVIFLPIFLGSTRMSPGYDLNENS